MAERPRPPQIVQHELWMAAEESGEYFWGPLWLLSIDFVIIEPAVLIVVFSFQTLGGWKFRGSGEAFVASKKGNTYKSN